ncbi:amidohydrolase [Sphingopyxis sp. H038]|uniref:amidohydrolase family protein n=1 Tax=unclassified Sphingopyxis TaxID=2614943 RepID=UPI0007300479|nr:MULTISPECIES: amidohydrolase family protein [unclassified Sphingopyxis]KTE02161.1 amidohydrolase [Sphingopyxis sp. H012]KTE09910.1 amidohydrolase [Sphingopyxis sp. H053]KTE15307.1 amidohydrolase [Sphingopyxis sp. H093]KTE26208.1 amidohydrolase [Sphingopyxis sp. H080]KTE33647.1 amidohydrolase [Sphingopyxis sp. H038]
MRLVLIAALLASAASGPVYAHETAAPVAQSKPVPKEQLLKPPADAVQYVVVSEAGQHGSQWRWQMPDGRTAYRWSQELRGWITEMDQVTTFGPGGAIEALTVRGVTTSGDAAEEFRIANGRATWKTANDSGEATAGGWYIPAGGVGIANAPLMDALAAAGDAGLNFLPGGKGRMTFGPTQVIQGPGGPKKVQLAFVSGILPSPLPVWLDENKRYFADISYISVIPAGYEGALKQLRNAQEAATAEAVAGIAKRFLSPAAKAPVLFDNVQLFDADKGVFLPARAVLAQGGKIAAIGAAGSLKAPAGAQIIDGRGKTLVPGIWDSHLHIGDDWDVLSNMANGITSFRSPGTTFDRAVEATRRRADGSLLMGEPFISVIIDKKDPLAAQGAEVVSSAEEAIAAVRRVKAAGLWGVKFYTSMNPAWIAPAAAEAHKLGLHVHGHVPATMKPSEAVAAGYDELTHLNFVVMESMPREVIDKANTRQRVEGPARYFKDVDLDGPVMSRFIADLAAKKTLVDPTIVIFEGMLTQDGGKPQPAYAPYMGIISPVLERSVFTAGGYPLVEGLTRDDYRKSYAKMVQLVGKLHKAGVPIVAGTDGWGIELIRELEIYQQAGFSPAEAIQSATIVPARVVGADKRTGSIAVGKEADLVLVDGDPSTDLGALRRVVTVVSDGYVMDANELRKAAGYSGTPK